MFRRIVRWSSHLVILAVLLSVSPAAVLAGAFDADPPVAAWQRQLAAIESRLHRVQAQDEATRVALGAELASLRRAVLAALDPLPDGSLRLEEGQGGTTLPELAAEIGRLRAALSRLTASTAGAGPAGAFYLGRVEVAVTAEAAAAATAEATPPGVAVLDAQVLEANDKTNLASALALAPGVSWMHVGQRNEGTVYVRGFDLRQVPLFIDGIPIYTPYDGLADLDRFTTFDVAEVRVSKGFTSVLYGANALGGAINIVSRRPSGRLEGRGGVGYGSGGARNLYVNAGSGFAKWYLQGSASYSDSDTYPLAGGFKGVKAQGPGDRVNADRRDGRVSAKAGWTPNGTDEYAVSYVGQRGRKGNPPYAGTDPAVKTRYWRWPTWDKDSVYFVANQHLGASSYLRGRLFRDTYDNSLYAYDDARYSTQVKSSSFRSLYADHTSGGSLEWGATLGRHSVRAVGHLKTDKHQDHNSGEPPKQFEGRIVSVGVEDSIIASSKLSLVAGVGADWQTTTLAVDQQKGQTIDLLAGCRDADKGCGDAHGVNPQVGAFYSVPGGLVRLTLSRKTRMPSMRDRYSYKFGTAVPNPGLSAEHNVTIETGYQGALGRHSSFQAAVFYSRIQDLMQRVYLKPNLSQLRNQGRAEHAGIEVDVRTRVLPRVEFDASYTLLDRNNLSDPLTRLVDTPRHKGRLSAVVALPGPSLRLMVTADMESGRQTQNEAGAYLDVPSFATANVKGSWTIARRVDAELSVLNLFDRDWWVADGYPEPGRMVLATLRCRF